MFYVHLLIKQVLKTQHIKVGRRILKFHIQSLIKHLLTRQSYQDGKTYINVYGPVTKQTCAQNNKHIEVGRLNVCAKIDFTDERVKYTIIAKTKQN